MGKVSPCEKSFVVDARDLVVDLLCGPLEENFFLSRKLSHNLSAVAVSDSSTGSLNRHLSSSLQISS